MEGNNRKCVSHSDWEDLEKEIPVLMNTIHCKTHLSVANALRWYYAQLQNSWPGGLGWQILTYPRQSSKLHSWAHPGFSNQHPDHSHVKLAFSAQTDFFPTMVLEAHVSWVRVRCAHMHRLSSHHRHSWPAACLKYTSSVQTQAMLFVFPACSPSAHIKSKWCSEL